MSFTSKNLLSEHKGSMNFFKGATLFFLGMSCIFFAARAFEIVPVAQNTISYLQQIFLTASGDNHSDVGIILD